MINNNKIIQLIIRTQLAFLESNITYPFFEEFNLFKFKREQNWAQIQCIDIDSNIQLEKIIPLYCL